MAVPEVIPHIQKIPELVQGTTVTAGKFPYSQNGVTKYIDAADLIAAINASITSSEPTGTIRMFTGSGAMTGYLLCDNSAVSRTTYSALFALIGTTYGAGNGTTTFNVPDLRGRAPIGAGTGIEHIAPNPTDPLTARTLGAYYGLETASDTDNAAVTIGDTAATGTVSVTMNTFTPSGTVSAPTFTGTIATLTGVVAITDPGHTHDVTTTPKTVTDGVANAAENTTYTTDSSVTNVTAALTMTPYTPAGTVSTPTFVGTGAAPTVSSTGFTGIDHTHTGNASITVTTSTIQPVTTLNFYIKI